VAAVLGLRQPALLDGNPGAGKSLLTADLAARLTRGRLTAVAAHEIELVVIDSVIAFFKPEGAADNDQVMRVALATLAAQCRPACAEGGQALRQ
jgi:hypothetical protein